jgi:hypothetical protein
MDVTHFANNYCKVKVEDGTYKIIKLRDYQYEILEMFDENKFNILMASRQIGKCMEHTTPLVIYDKKLKVYYNTTFFQLFFKLKENKTIYDYLKYGLYWTINKLS